MLSTRSRYLRVGGVGIAVALVAGACGSGKIGDPVASSAATNVSQSCYIGGCVSSGGAAPVSAVPATVGSASSWVPATANLAGLPSQCGNVTLLSAAPDRSLVIAGVALQGLWARVNGSQTWTRLGQGPGSAIIANRPSSITYDPLHPGTFWESGIYNGGGAYVTDDSGATFRQLGQLTHSDYVSVDLSDPARRTLLSGRHEASSLFRSNDGGATWSDISSTLPAGIGYTVAPVVLGRSTFLLGTSGGTGSGVFRSTSGGASWTNVYPTGVAGPAMVDESDHAVYWVLAGSGGLIKSTDQGATWRLISPISSVGGILLQLPNGWLAGVNSQVVLSADHGVTWTAVGPPLPFTPSGVVYSPGSKSFYVWRSDCTFSGDTSVQPDAIMELNVAIPST